MSSALMDLLVATTNPGKLNEIRELLANAALRILSVNELAGPPRVVEDGVTFEENALKKARSFAAFSGLATLADDSGLVVDALGGAPGVYSARYGGVDGDDARNNAKLLRELQDVPEERRTARFVCALALCFPLAQGGHEAALRESCEGRIAFEPRGANGFGYDPLFFYPPFGKTFGEIDRKTKAGVSHRGKALRRMAAMLPRLLSARINP